MPRRLRRWLTKLYVYYGVRADERAKCPACGHRRKHKIVYSPSYRALLHQCAFCSAAFSEQPLVSAELWAVEPQLGPVDEQAPLAAMGAPREPMRAK